MMSILLTGASGEVGRFLIKRLDRLGLEFKALTRSPNPGVNHMRGRWVQGDITDPAGLDKAFDGVKTVLHLAGITHTNNSRLYYSVNVDGTQNLIEAAIRHDAGQFIYFSTRAIGKSGGAYSHSKWLAEKKVKASRLPFVILRPAEIFSGKGNDPVMNLVNWIRKRPFVPVIGDGQYRLSPVFVEDVVSAVIASIGNPKTRQKTYVLAGPEEMTYLEMINRIEHVLGVRRKKIFIPVFLARGIVYMMSILGIPALVKDQIPRLLLPKSADNSQAVRDLGYAPKKLEDNLTQLLNAGSYSQS